LRDVGCKSRLSKILISFCKLLDVLDSLIVQEYLVVQDHLVVQHHLFLPVHLSIFQQVLDHLVYISCNILVIREYIYLTFQVELC